jgi:cob(I)alamin adenosyltransferase
MKIYTKTGDKGETSLWGGSRIGKNAVRIHAYGTVDECNTVIGVVRSFGVKKELDLMLEHIQGHLFVVGADLAAPGNTKTAIPRIDPESVLALEKWIDQLNEALPSLKQFILPGGTPAAAFLHLARTVCRRAERLTVELSSEESACQNVIIYLNRLADFLFTAARTANYQAESSDRHWEKQNRNKDQE